MHAVQTCAIRYCVRHRDSMFFFFQAEDGIRDIGVTGVQTCALPIYQTEHYRKKKEVLKELEAQRRRISDLQERLYAENRQGLLVVLQAMDTGGKDGTIKHVFGGVKPQGCRVSSFNAPNPVEANHEFMWRYHKSAPARGRIGIFNRSHYEDVLVVRVKELVEEDVWRQRYALINEFERNLTRNGITVLKFFLHISKDEQKRRLEARLARPDKRWKFSKNDIRERDRKSTRLNSSHANISYAVFCLKKKK